NLNMIHAPGVAALLIDAGDGGNLVNLLDVPAPGLTPAPLTIAVNTGTGSDQVSVYAGQPNHTINTNTGGGADLVTLDGDPARNGGDAFTVVLGDGNDTAQVAGADLASSDTVHLDGGNHFDTLLYDAAGRPITPGAPTLPDGSLALV